MDPLNWYIQNITTATSKDTNFIRGGLYLFKYDPKWKEELPYYDILPLVLALEISKDRFIGLNVHYLLPERRLELFAKLIRYAPRTSKDVYYLNVDYNTVKNITNIYKPCIKEYLYDHVRTKIVAINRSEWLQIPNVPLREFNKLIIAPLERFVNESKETVWRNSEYLIR